MNGDLEDLPDDPEPFPPRHSTKPDPEEPYRYVCPECESQVYSQPRDIVYRCEWCGDGYRKEDLKDLKDGLDGIDR